MYTKLMRAMTLSLLIGFLAINAAHAGDQCGGGTTPGRTGTESFTPPPGGQMHGAEPNVQTDLTKTGPTGVGGGTAGKGDELDGDDQVPTDGEKTAKKSKKDPKKYNPKGSSEKVDSDKTDADGKRTITVKGKHNGKDCKKTIEIDKDGTTTETKVFEKNGKQTHTSVEKYKVSFDGEGNRIEVHQLLGGESTEKYDSSGKMTEQKIKPSDSKLHMEEVDTGSAIRG